MNNEDEVKEAPTAKVEKEQFVELKLQTLNEIMGFLAEQPWKSANGFISKIHQEIQVKPPYTK